MGDFPGRGWVPRHALLRRKPRNDPVLPNACGSALCPLDAVVKFLCGKVHLLQIRRPSSLKR